MSGIKVKIVVEPGDSVAELKIVHQPGDGPQDERVVKVGGTVLEAQEEYDIELSSTLRITVERVGRVMYDPEQLTNYVVGEGDPDPQEQRAKKLENERKEEAEKREKESKRPKSGKGAHETGAKEADHEEEHSTVQGARSTADLPGRTHKGDTPKTHR